MIALPPLFGVVHEIVALLRGSATAVPITGVEGAVATTGGVTIVEPAGSRYSK